MLSPRKRTALLAAILLAAIGAGAIVLATSGGPPHRTNAPRRALSHPAKPLLPLTVPASRLSLRAPARFAPRAGTRPQIAARRHRTHRFGTTANPVNGELFSATTGTWTGNPTSYAYQWQDCDTGGLNCIAIALANASTYTLVSSDIGFTIRVAVTATNPFGFATQPSAATGIVAASAAPTPQITIAPAMTGTATQGQTLSTTNGTWSGTPTSYAYQWQDCDASVSCTDIAGATSSTYVLGATDVNQFVRATVIATNGSGTGTAFSNVSTAVTANTTGTAGTWNGTQETGLSTTTCNKYAATTGNDSTGDGSLGNPYATPSKLASILTTGQVGCLRAGTYSVGNWTDSTASETITAYPAEVVIIDGGVDLTGASIDLSYLNISLSSLYAGPALCGGQTQGARPVLLDGDSDVLEHDNVYDAASLTALQRYNAVGIGWNRTPPDQETGAIVSDNRIHDYGAGCANDNGVWSKGKNGQINDNWIYNDNSSAAAIQFFASTPQPNHNHTYANVMDHVGEGFLLFEEGTGYTANTNDHNVITNTSHYAGFATNDANSTNTFTTSDGFTTTTPWPCDAGNSGCGTITTSGNLNVDPSYNNAASFDFRVNNSSLSTWSLWDGDYGTSSPPPPSPGPGPPSGSGTWTGTQEVGASTTTCDYYVSTTGSNSNAGTGPGNGQAWQTIDKLVGSLPTGKTGCLESGAYGSTSDRWIITTPNVTITAAPGAAVTISGGPLIQYQATGVTLSYLNLDENYVFATSGQEGLCVDTTYVPLPLEVDGNNDAIVHDNIYQTDVPAQDRTNGIGFGWNPNPSTHTVTGATIAYNRIHDFGNNCGKAHGIYEAAVDHSSIFDNWFWGDPSGGACIQVTDSHPLPEVGPHDDTLYSNVCDNVNIGFFLYGESAYYQNIVMQHNIIRNTHLYGGFAANSGNNSTIQFINNDGTSIADGWPCGPNGGCGAVFTSGNITTAPGFSDASSNTTHDYRVSAASPAVSWGMWDGDSGQAGNILGSTAVGSTAVALDANANRANCFTATANGTVSRLSAYLSPTGIAGTQKLAGGIYAYSAGAPGALLARTTELAFPSTSLTGWYDMPLQGSISVANGTAYCLALDTGTTTQVAAARVTTTTAAGLFYNLNTYVSGALPDPFGAASTGHQQMSIYATISP